MVSGEANGERGGHLQLTSCSGTEEAEIQQSHRTCSLPRLFLQSFLALLDLEISHTLHLLCCSALVLLLIKSYTELLLSFKRCRARDSSRMIHRHLRLDRPFDAKTALS